jgi:hypothetical protein
MTLSNCDRCKRPLIEIDHFGESLIGCIDCNRWGWCGSRRLFMELPEEELEALRRIKESRTVRAGHRVSLYL